MTQVIGESAMSLKIIGAGHGRTGTASLGLALEQLGFGPCYHGGEQVYGNQTLGRRLWLRAFNRESVDWGEIFNGYAATIDSPGCVFYRELAERYPAAKVILTVREPNAWFASAWSTYLAPECIARIKALGPDVAEFLDQELSICFGPRIDRESAIASYHRHNEEVQKAIDPERLLIYEVAQGWGPLCQFLHVFVPNTPFPHSHARPRSA